MTLPCFGFKVPSLSETADTSLGFQRIACAAPRQWLYRFGDEGVVYSETQNRFAGFDAAAFTAYRALDAGVSVEELRELGNSRDASPKVDGLEAIAALAQGIFPSPEGSTDWPPFEFANAADAPTANIEVDGIPIRVDFPHGPLESLARDYFRNCPASSRTARCHISARETVNCWAIIVNGRPFFSLEREEQIGLGLMHVTRSLLYALGEYDVAFHAAMVARGDCGVMLCAPRERGKSTLAAFLMARGFDLLTDEPALLHLDTSSVSSLPLPVSLKEGSWPLLCDELPQLANAPIHIRSDGTKIRMVHPLPLRPSDGPRRLTQIVFPQYGPMSVAQLKRASPINALRLLNEAGLLLAANCARNEFEALLNLICRTPAFEIRFASLEVAWEMLRSTGC